MPIAIPSQLPPAHVTPYLRTLIPLADAALPDLAAFHDEDGIDLSAQSRGYDTGLALGFKAPHRSRTLERFVPGNSSIMGRVHAQTFTAQAADGFDIPNLFIEWAEIDDLLSAVIDFFPLTDLALDKEYRARVYDPLEPAWEQFRRFAGAGFHPSVFRFVRAFASPVYIGFHLPKTPENVERCMEIHTAYFSHWLRLAADAQPVADPERAAYANRRKRAMIGTMLTSSTDVNDLVPQLIGRETARAMGPVTAKGFRPPDRSGLSTFTQSEEPVLAAGATGDALAFAEALAIGSSVARVLPEWNEVLAIDVPGGGTVSVRFAHGSAEVLPGLAGPPENAVRQSLADFGEAVTDEIPLQRLWARLSEPFNREHVLKGNGLKLVHLYQAVRGAMRVDPAADARVRSLLRLG